MGVSGFIDGTHPTGTLTPQAHWLIRTPYLSIIAGNVLMNCLRYWKLERNTPWHLTNEHCCSKHCCSLYEQNGTVNSVGVDDWTADLLVHF